MLFVTIREGVSPEDARPIAVIRDEYVIRRLVEALQERLLATAQEGPALRLPAVAESEEARQ